MCRVAMQLISFVPQSLNCVIFSLTTSAAFLLGGTLGNYDVYTMSSVNSILAGIFFVPLFLVFSAFGFTILTAVVLRKHNLCADSVQQGVLKYKLEKQVTWRFGSPGARTRIA